MKNTDIKTGIVTGLAIAGTITGLTIGGVAPMILFGSGLIVSVSEIKNILIKNK